MFEHVTPRLINAALVARKSLDQNQENSVGKRDFLSPKATNWRRSVSLFRLLYEHFPTTFDNLIERTLNTVNLPLVNKDLVFLGNGGEQIVFKVKDLPNVLKINRQSLLIPDSQVEVISKKTMNEYLTICNWYKDIDIEIPHQSFLSFQIKNPVMNKKVAAIIEPFDDSFRRDFFATSEAEILRFAHQDLSFNNSLTQFIDKTLAILDQQGLIIDLNGDTNVCIKDTKSGKKIWFTDPHIIYDKSKKESKPPKTWAKLDQRINLLRSLQKYLNPNSDSGTSYIFSLNRTNTDHSVLASADSSPVK